MCKMWIQFLFAGVIAAPGCGSEPTNPVAALAPSNTDNREGPPGLTGATGATGSAGDRGAMGATGATGPTGDPGKDGSAGQDGKDGATGAMGPRGANGDSGASGAIGATGIEGATGSTGQNGAIGATGATGVAGRDGQDAPMGGDWHDPVTGIDWIVSAGYVSYDEFMAFCSGSTSGYRVAKGFEIVAAVANGLPITGHYAWVQAQFWGPGDPRYIVGSSNSAIYQVDLQTSPATITPGTYYPGIGYCRSVP